MGKRENRQQKSNVPLFCRIYLLIFFPVWGTCFWHLKFMLFIFNPYVLVQSFHLELRVIWGRECYECLLFVCEKNVSVLQEFCIGEMSCSLKDCVSLLWRTSIYKENWLSSQIEAEWVLNKGRLMFNYVISVTSLHLMSIWGALWCWIYLNPWRAFSHLFHLHLILFTVTLMNI